MLYMLINDYTATSGSTIYGIFDSKEIAELELERLLDPSNEYDGFRSDNEAANIEIRPIKLNVNEWV